MPNKKTEIRRFDMTTPCLLVQSLELATDETQIKHGKDSFLV